MSENEERDDPIRAVVARESAKAVQGSASWTPSALSLMDEEEFTQRLELMKTERRRIALIQKSVMVEGHDYGTIEGTQKPTLLQPGAQVLNKFAGFAPEYREELTRGDGDQTPSIAYRVRCQLLDRAGGVVSEGLGSSNSHEVKHRYRYAKIRCPVCNAEAVIKGRDEYGGGWLCFGKKGGCGQKWEDGAAEIERQNRGLVQNPDPDDLDNTLLKMAAKRAYMAATVNAHAISDAFSQDWDDLSESAKEQLREGEEIAKKGRGRQKAEPKKNGNGGPAPDAPLTQGQRELIDGAARKRAASLDMGPNSPDPTAWERCRAWAYQIAAPGREPVAADQKAIHDAIAAWEGEAP